MIYFLILISIVFSNFYVCCQNPCMALDTSQTLCKLCSSNYYDQNYYEKSFSNWSFPQTIKKDECLKQNSTLINLRKVMILTNFSIESSFSEFDAIYTSFIGGLLSETKFLLSFNVKEEKIYLSKGIHYQLKYQIIKKDQNFFYLT